MKISKRKLRKFIKEAVIKEIGFDNIVSAVKDNLPIPTDVMGALEHLITAPQADGSASRYGDPAEQTLEIDYAGVASDLGISPEEVIAEMEESAKQATGGPAQAPDIDSTNQYVSWVGSAEELAALLKTLSARGVDVAEENMELIK